MTDELKTIEADEAATVGYVRTHMLYIVGAVCLLLGFIAGHIHI